MADITDTQGQPDAARGSTVENARVASSTGSALEPLLVDLYAGDFQVSIQPKDDMAEAVLGYRGVSWTRLSVQQFNILTRSKLPLGR